MKNVSFKSSPKIYWALFDHPDILHFSHWHKMLVEKTEIGMYSGEQFVVEKDGQTVHIFKFIYEE
jgi:hypothetical protein